MSVGVPPASADGASPAADGAAASPVAGASVAVVSAASLLQEQPAINTSAVNATKNLAMIGLHKFYNWFKNQTVGLYIAENYDVASKNLGDLRILARRVSAAILCETSAALAD